MEDARAFVLHQWNWARKRLPPWLHDEWEGVADTALLQTVRDYREDRGTTFSTFLFKICRRSVNSLVEWAGLACRKEPPIVSLSAEGSANWVEMGRCMADDPRCDLSVRVWAAAMGLGADLVTTRFVEDRPLTTRQRSRIKVLIKTLRRRYSARKAHYESLGETYG